MSHPFMVIFIGDNKIGARDNLGRITPVTKFDPASKETRLAGYRDGIAKIDKIEAERAAQRAAA